MRKLLSIAFIALLLSCQEATPVKESNSMNGLWVVQLVEAGGETMTPNARWTRFNPDSTQTSGNGWKQHSIGTWKFNSSDSSLQIMNSNGLEDPNEPFTVRLDKDTMYWSRMEDGMDIKVKLFRAEKPPLTYSDQILGLWQVNKVEGEGEFLNEMADQLYIGWDGRFRIVSQTGRIYGVYNVHGHRSELELIPYGENLSRSFWKVDFGEEEIQMELLNSDSTVTRNLQRAYSFNN